MIKFLVDTSSDYDMKEAKENQIEVISIAIEMGNETFYDGINITREEFYKKLEESDEFPKTSQPSPQSFVDVFEKAKENKDQLICVLLSSKLSGTIQSAMLAKNMVGYDGIYIVDSLTATYAIKVIADYGIELAKEGKSAEEIIDILEKIKSKVKVFAVLDTLENLYKGGRLSKLEAGVGNIAKIKPLITLTEEGGIGVKGKSIGRKKAFNDIMKLIEKEEIDTKMPVYIIRSYDTNNSQMLKDSVEALGIHTMPDILQIGPTIGTHIGAGAYGIIFVRK